MSKRDIVKLTETIGAGIILTQIITHPNGFTRILDATWTLVYGEDWDYHASRFAD